MRLLSPVFKVRQRRRGRFAADDYADLFLGKFGRRLNQRRRVCITAVKFFQVHRHAFGNQGSQHLGDGDVVLFGLDTRRKSQVGLILQDAVDHAGTRRMGAQLQEYANTILIGLVYGGRKVKPVQGLVENGICRLVAG